MKSINICFAAAFSVFISYPVTAQSQFTFSLVDFPSANAGGATVTGTNLNGIAPNGLEAVGSYFTGTGASRKENSFLFSGNFFPLLGPDSNAYGINNTGTISGGFLDTSTDPDRNSGYLITRSSGTPQVSQVFVPGSKTTIARGINNQNDAVGSYTFSDPNGGANAPTFTTGFVFDDPTGGVLPTSSPGGGFQPIEVQFDNPDNPGQPFRADSTNPLGINDAGDIVGSFGLGGNTFGFLFRGGDYINIAVPGASGGTFVSDINNNGDIVGYFSNGTTFRAFKVSGADLLLDNGAFNTQAVETFDVKAGDFTAPLTLATGISDGGLIVGSFLDGNGVEHGYVASPVPLPAALGLLVSGLVGLGLRSRKRKS